MPIVQERRDVRHLGHVDPAHRLVEGVLAGHHPGRSEADRIEGENLPYGISYGLGFGYDPETGFFGCGVRQTPCGLVRSCRRRSRMLGADPPVSFGALVPVQRPSAGTRLLSKLV
jgi:hypothetical protein